jgi:hypothetical protein
MLGEKSVLVPLSPPQISHWLALDRAVFSMTRDQQLAAWGSEVKKSENFSVQYTLVSEKKKHSI